MSEEVKSHLFAIRTTGGQEKVVMRLLEAKANANQINIQSVFWVSDLKGYVVVEAVNPSDAYLAVEGVRHIRGQLRGELAFEDIEGYLVKKSTVLTLAVDNIIEITGGPFKGMKATITRIDPDKDEYQQHLRLVLTGILGVGAIGFTIQFVFSVITFGR